MQPGFQLQSFRDPSTVIAALITARSYKNFSLKISFKLDCTTCSLLCNSSYPWQLNSTESTSALLLHLSCLLQFRLLMPLCSTGIMNMKTAIICLGLLALVGTSMGALDAVKKDSEIQGLDHAGTPEHHLSSVLLSTLLMTSKGPDCSTPLAQCPVKHSPVQHLCCSCSKPASPQ